LGCPTGVLGDGTGEPLTGNVALAHLIIVCFGLISWILSEGRKSRQLKECTSIFIRFLVQKDLYNPGYE
jgi:hypothetical protein